MDVSTLQEDWRRGLRCAVLACLHGLEGILVLKKVLSHRRWWRFVRHIGGMDNHKIVLRSLECMRANSESVDVGDV